MRAAFAWAVGAGLVVSGCAGDPAPPKVPAAHAAAERGRHVYAGTCKRCHETGLEGATRIGDAGAWAGKEAKGLDALSGSAIRGFQGKWGDMPPRGGNDELTDDDVKAAVRYMVTTARAATRPGQ